MGEDGGSINRSVVGVGAKLRHRQEAVGADVVVEPLGDDLFQHLADALEEANRAIGLRVAVVRFVWLVEDDDGGVVPGVGPSV